MSEKRKRRELTLSQFFEWIGVWLLATGAIVVIVGGIVFVAIYDDSSKSCNRERYERDLLLALSDKQSEVKFHSENIAVAGQIKKILLSSSTRPKFALYGLREIVELNISKNYLTSIKKASELKELCGLRIEEKELLDIAVGLKAANNNSEGKLFSILFGKSDNVIKATNGQLKKDEIPKGEGLSGSFYLIYLFACWCIITIPSVCAFYWRCIGEKDYYEGEYYKVDYRFPWIKLWPIVMVVLLLPGFVVVWAICLLIGIGLLLFWPFKKVKETHQKQRQQRERDLNYKPVSFEQSEKQLNKIASRLQKEGGV